MAGDMMQQKSHLHFTYFKCTESSPGLILFPMHPMPSDRQVVVVDNTSLPSLSSDPKYD